MALASPSASPSLFGSRLAPTATSFESRPAPINTSKIMDATFVTRSPPDVSRNASVVGLCAIPCERAGADDLGWHIADFLAFKTLLSPIVRPAAQTWISHCDVAAEVKKNPESYTHGGRVVAAAANNKVGSENGKMFDDEIKIHVEPSATKLATKFQIEVYQRAKRARENRQPLIIIICGLTTLEQDIYFGDQKYSVCVTNEQLRVAIGSDVKATLLTPSLTSAGWQVNPSISLQPTLPSISTPIKFLAKQCGGVFSSFISHEFLSWKSPFIDHDRVDEEVKATEAFPGPPKLSEEQQAAREEFRDQLHSLLAARLMRHHDDHTFSFDSTEDDWDQLIGPRRGQRLEEYALQWRQLDDATTETDPHRLKFLGTAFGGRKESQLNHIKHLVQESFSSFPGYYESEFGKRLLSEAKQFPGDSHPNELDCRAMFNTMEHRMSQVYLSDLIVKYAGLHPAFNQRCRDWDEPKWTQVATEDTKRIASEVFGSIIRNLPSIQMPLGRNVNLQSKLHAPYRVPTFYLAASLALRYNAGSQLESALDGLLNLIDQIRDHQVTLLMSSPELEKKAKAWLDSVNVAARQPRTNSIHQFSNGTANRSANGLNTKEMDENMKLTESNGSIALNETVYTSVGHPNDMSSKERVVHVVMTNDETGLRRPLATTMTTNSAAADTGRESCSRSPAEATGQQEEVKMRGTWVPPHLRHKIPVKAEPMTTGSFTSQTAGNETSPAPLGGPSEENHEASTIQSVPADHTEAQLQEPVRAIAFGNRLQSNQKPTPEATGYVPPHLRNRAPGFVPQVSYR
ncbi:uncharacterized protein BCR38DRAFT_526185 [Pseudomassariella vexata]|uniref:Uncharacterized protein n=1 Tax=Pseudomassariella vexata TaxID=1141098 RepID=A0A1Y2DN73_9PEZI|nr:uncharacterized protein BCR38DRAFT_526185 [Pseudomassariella vexata]ORY60586.1 hypothetical protein BCR38DRAFT_526185 [Pseudomassariella vexata]